MKVLIADQFEQSGIDAIIAAGCDVVYEPSLADQQLADALTTRRPDILVVRSTRVTEPMLADTSLSLIVRAGAGVNTIDVDAASRRGIYVSNCPGKNSHAVAELTFALILALDRRIAENVSDLRAGNWNKKEFSKARGLMGQTLGLLGFGHIGREVARRARAFGMPVIVWSRRFSSDATLKGAAEQEFDIEVVESPQALMSRADIVSIHVALTKDTRGFVNAELLSHAKQGAFIINTARAEVMDYQALAEAVKEKGLRVGLDVFENEPSAGTAEFSDALATHGSVYGTHHIGASTDQAQEAIAGETVRIIRTFKDTGRVPNVVNLAKRTPATHRLVVRHRDRPGVLAHVFDHLGAGNLNVQETENVIFEGAEAAVARINLDGAPPADLLRTIEQGNQNILSLHVIEIERTPSRKS